MCRLSNIVRLSQEKNLLKALQSVGVKRSSVEVITDEFDRKPKKGETYYYYNGPLDKNTREFCRKMLQIDKVFSQKDIDKLSRYLNYDVLEFVGAYNCRHQWVKFRGREIATAPPTVKQINDLIRAGIKVK